LLHHDRDITPQVPEGPDIGVIHMGVRQKDCVQPGQLPGAKRGLHQTPGAQFRQTPADADAPFQRRVGKQERATDVQKHRGMSQPGNRQSVARPGEWLGPLGRGRDVDGSHSGV
jgi:hypothetical protein